MFNFFPLPMQQLRHAERNERNIGSPVAGTNIAEEVNSLDLTKE
jgi:hypothetical protein